MPHLKNAGTVRWKHAVLQAIEAFTMDRGHESARGQAENDAGR